MPYNTAQPRDGRTIRRHSRFCNNLAVPPEPLPIQKYYEDAHTRRPFYMPTFPGYHAHISQLHCHAARLHLDQIPRALSTSEYSGHPNMWKINIIQHRSRAIFHISTSHGMHLWNLQKIIASFSTDSPLRQETCGKST